MHGSSAATTNRSPRDAPNSGLQCCPQHVRSVSITSSTWAAAAENATGASSHTTRVPNLHDCCLPRDRPNRTGSYRQRRGCVQDVSFAQSYRSGIGSDANTCPAQSGECFFFVDSFLYYNIGVQRLSTHAAGSLEGCCYQQYCSHAHPMEWSLHPSFTRLIASVQ